MPDGPPLVVGKPADGCLMSVVGAQGHMEGDIHSSDVLSYSENYI